MHLTRDADFEPMHPATARHVRPWLQSRRSVWMISTLVVTVWAAVLLSTGPVYAAALPSPQLPNIVCCGNKDATLTATAIDNGHYAYISASSSGWISGSYVYLWYYVVDPAGTQSITYPLGSCRPSGGTCSASTTWYAGYCALLGTYHVYVWGTISRGSQVSNTADPTFTINASC